MIFQCDILITRKANQKSVILNISWLTKVNFLCSLRYFFSVCYEGHVILALFSSWHEGRSWLWPVVNRGHKSGWPSDMSQHQRKVKSTLDWLDALTNVFLCGPFDNNQVSRVRVSPNSWINTNRPQFNPLEVHATVLTICYFKIVPVIMTSHQSFKVQSKIRFLNFQFFGFYLK